MSLTMRIPLLALIAVTACAGEPAESDILSMSWEAVDQLDGTVPTGIRVYRGHNDDLPLRAWYVHIDQAAPHIRTQVVVSDDEFDSRETVSSFSDDLDACVVVN